MLSPSGASVTSGSRGTSSHGRAGAGAGAGPSRSPSPSSFRRAGSPTRVRGGAAGESKLDASGGEEVSGETAQEREIRITTETEISKFRAATDKWMNARRVELGMLGTNKQAMSEMADKLLGYASRYFSKKLELLAKTQLELTGVKGTLKHTTHELEVASTRLAHLAQGVDAANKEAEVRTAEQRRIAINNEKAAFRARLAEEQSFMKAQQLEMQLEKRSSEISRLRVELSKLEAWVTEAQKDPKVPLAIRRGPSSLKRVRLEVDPEHVEVKRLTEELELTQKRLDKANRIIEKQNQEMDSTTKDLVEAQMAKTESDAALSRETTKRLKMEESVKKLARTEKALQEARDNIMAMTDEMNRLKEIETDLLLSKSSRAGSPMGRKSRR